MTAWQERLAAAETRRSANAEYWSKALPEIFRECIAPAAHEFRAAAAAHVQADATELPAEMKVVLRFDDWHLGEWTLSVRLLPSTEDEATLRIATPPDAPREFRLSRESSCTKEAFLDWITDAYVERVSRGP